MVRARIIQRIAKLKILPRLLAILLLAPLAIFLYCWAMYILTLQIGFAAGLEAPTPAGRAYIMFMRILFLALPLCGLFWFARRRAKPDTPSDHTGASKRSAEPRPWWAWVTIWVGGAIMVAPVTAWLLMYTPWPLSGLNRITEETHLTFPPSARLEGGYFVWAGVEAKVRMPREALAAFLHQPSITARVLPLQQVDQRVLAEWDFAFHGWDVGTLRRPQYRTFAGGDATCWILFGPDDTPDATVYIYTDDP